MESRWNRISNVDSIYDNVEFIMIPKLSNVIKILNEQSEVLKEDLNDPIYYDIMYARSGVFCYEDMAISHMWTNKYDLYVQFKLNTSKPTSYDGFYESCIKEDNKFVFGFGLENPNHNINADPPIVDPYTVTLSITKTDEYKYEDYENAIEALSYNGYSGTKALEDMIFSNSYELHFMPKDFYD